MLRKTSLALLCGALFTTNTFAANEDIGVYGNITYDFTTDVDYYDDEDRLQDSYVGFFIKGKINNKADYVLDVAASHSYDFVTTHNNDFYEDGFSFDLNKVMINYQYREDIRVDFGRMFTPIGFYHDDPLNKDKLFDSTIRSSRYTDGLNAEYSMTKNNIDIKFNGFAGVRLDDSSSSSNWGANVLFGNDTFGHLTFGFLNINIDGMYYIEGFQEELQAKDGQTFIVGHLYESESINTVVNYSFTDFDTFAEQEHLYAQLRYKFDLVEAYVAYDYSSGLSGDKESLYQENYEVSKYIVGTEVNLTTDIGLYGEVALYDDTLNNFDETLYNIGVNFQF